MAALAKDRNTPAREGGYISVGVKAATKIYAGSLVVKAAGGYAEPGKKAENLVVLGRAEHFADNTDGVDGAIDVLVRKGVFAWENAAGNAAVGKALVGESKAYILDDQTVTKTAAGATSAGKVVAIDSEGVWVETR